MELAAVIRSEGGVTTRDRLLVAGFPPRAITWAVRGGSILRIRRAHYAVPDAPLDRRIAVASGGRLGARSALSSYGVWTVGDGTVHVSWPAHGNVARPARISGYPDLRRSGGVDISPHWRVRRLSTHRECWRESIEEALAQHLLTADDRETVAAMDSVLHIGALSTGSVASILERMPRRQRRLAAAVDGGADSGLESFARFWLWREGISYLAHPVLAGLEVDLLVGDSLVIETDGREFHSRDAAFERDRRRDNLLGSRGFVVVRFSYRQVVDEWDACAARIRTHLSHRDHLRPIAR